MWWQEHRARIRARCPTDEELQQHKQLWRDSHLSVNDIKTLKHEQQLQQWQLHADPAASIHIWQQAHPDWVFCYQPQQQAADQIFVLGLQSDEQRQWLLQYGRVLFMDSTFGTNNCRVRQNEYQVNIYVYTCCASDQHVLVVFVQKHRLQDSWVGHDSCSSPSSQSWSWTTISGVGRLHGRCSAAASPYRTLPCSFASFSNEHNS